MIIDDIHEKIISIVPIAQLNANTTYIQKKIISTKYIEDH